MATSSHETRGLHHELREAVCLVLGVQAVRQVLDALAGQKRIDATRTYTDAVVRHAILGEIVRANAFTTGARGLPNLR